MGIFIIDIYINNYYIIAFKEAIANFDFCCMFFFSVRLLNMEDRVTEVQVRDWLKFMKGQPK